MKDFIGRTIFEGDWIVYCTRRGSHQDLILTTVLEVERDRIQVEPPNGKWLKTPAYIAILTEPQEWELA